MRIGVEAGTYIRKLIHDMGKYMGPGAHMQELRRTQTAHITEKDAVYLHDLLDAYRFWKEEGIEEEIRKCIKPVEYLVQHIPKIYVKDTAIGAIVHGAPVLAPGVCYVEEGISKGRIIGVMSLKGELVAIARAEMSTEQILKAKRGIVAKLDRVFMRPGVYPNFWKRKLR